MLHFFCIISTKKHLCITSELFNFIRISFIFIVSGTLVRHWHAENAFHQGFYTFNHSCHYYKGFKKIHLKTHAVFGELFFLTLFLQNRQKKDIPTGNNILMPPNRGFWVTLKITIEQKKISLG